MARQKNPFHIDFFADRVEPEATDAGQYASNGDAAVVAPDAAVVQPDFEFDADPIIAVESSSQEQTDISRDIEEALRDLEDQDSLEQFEIQ